MNLQAVKYSACAVTAYVLGSIKYELWFACMIITIICVLKVLHIVIFDYVQQNNKIHGKGLKDFSDKELVDEVIKRKG